MSKQIVDRVFEKKDVLMKIHASLSVYLGMDLDEKTLRRTRELQERLEFRITEAEENFLDIKIAIFSETLEIIKKSKNVKTKTK